MKKRWVKIFGGLALLVALLFILLPIGAKYYLIDWLEKNGADSASIGKLRYNPFLGRITLTGLEVEQGGQSRLHHSSLVLDFGITSLFNRDIRLEKVEYRDLSIDLEMHEDGSWRFASYTMPSKTEETKVKVEQGKAAPWAFLADRVILQNCQAHIKTPELDMTLVVTEAELNRFTTREGQPAGTFSFTGKLDDSPIVIQLDHLQIIPELHIDGNILVSNFKLSEISQLLIKALPTLDGEIGLDGKILFSQTAEKGIQVDYDGKVKVAQLDIGNNDFATIADSLTWEGRVQYGGPENVPATIETDGLLAARDFTLNVPGAKLIMRESRIDLSGKTSVILSSNIMVENEGSLLLEDVKLALPPYDITEKSLLWKGKVLYDSDRNKVGPLVSTNGSLDLGVLSLISGGQPASFSLGSEMLSWKGEFLFAQQNLGEKSNIEVDGALEGNELLAKLTEQQLQIGQGKVTLQTKSTISLGEEMDISGNSSLTLEQFSILKDGQKNPLFFFEKMAISDLQGQGVSTIAVKDVSTTGVKVSVPGNFPLAVEIPVIQLSDIFTDDLATFKVAGMSLKETFVTALHNNSELVSFDSLIVKDVMVDDRGAATIAVQDVTTTGVKVSVSGNFPLAIEIPEIQLSDIVTEDLATFKVAGMSLKETFITALHNNSELVSFDSLFVKDVMVDDKVKVTAGNVNVGSLNFLKAKDDTVKKAALSLSDVTLNNISWSGESGLQGETLQFEDLVTTIVRDKDGNINISKELQAMQLSSPEEEVEAEVLVSNADEEASKGAPFKLSKIIVGGNSALFFEDYTLAVPFITDLQISQFELTDIDSDKPDKETNILLKGEFEKRAPFEVTGYISPFKEKTALKMKLRLKNYPLSSLSAYTVQSVGTALASGQLKLKTKISIVDDVLDMENNIVLKKLETETISEELAAELNNELPIPLDAALSVLRDNKRNITLDIPLSGPLSELDVGISGVLITGLSKAIIPAASGYLVYALGPYAALAYVGFKVGEKLLQVDLPPVVFMQQETVITEEHAKYLERIGKLLIDRPEPDLQICPVVSSWEFLTSKEKTALKVDTIEVEDKNREKLLQLGQQRAIAVQDHLANKYSIELNRLLICDTKIEIERSTVPTVLLQL